MQHAQLMQTPYKMKNNEFYMMKRVLFLIMAFVSLNVMAQEPYKVFCELVGSAKFMSTKIIVTVDFGRKQNSGLAARSNIWLMTRGRSWNLTPW